MGKYIVKIVLVCLLFFGISSVSFGAVGISDEIDNTILGTCKGGSDCGLKGGVNQVKNAVEGTGIKTDVEGAEAWAALATYIQQIVVEVLKYLFFIMVVIIIYAGFLILTAAGDEDKVGKAKKIIMFAIIGAIVIYLAGPLTRFIFDMLGAK